MPRWFWLLIAIHLLPIWGVDYFLTQDGPIHVANAWTFFQYDSESAGLFREYYVRNLSPAPNWLIQLVLAALMSVFQPETAEKLLATSFVVLLPASLAYFSESVRKGSGAIAVLAFPMIFTWFLNTGLYNFCFGTAIYFFVTGYWFRTREISSPAHTLVMAASFVLLYFAHIFAFMTAAVTLSLIALIDWRPNWRALFSNAVAAIPALALTFLFVASKQGRVGAPTETVNILMDRASDMLYLAPFVSYRDGEAWAFGALALLLFVGLAIAAIRANGKRSRATLAVLSIPVAFGLLYLFLPKWALQGTFIPERSLYIAALGVIPVLAGSSLSALQERVFGGIGIAISLALIGLQMETMVGLNNELRDLMRCEQHIAPDSTLVPVNRAHGSRIEPMKHATSYWVVKHGMVSLGNFSAYRRNHPMLYREPMIPRPAIGCLDCNPTALDVRRYLAEKQGRVDYVLVRAGEESLPLTEDYTSVCLATEHGRIELFRSKMRN